MSTFKEKCIEFFGASDFYEILKIEKDASEKSVKKAYHKLSLMVHPDRVNEDQKALATEKFKVLGKIYSVLQDENKRKIYDDCGTFDEESDDDFNWMDYWRKLFKKIELKDIQDFEKEYIGSETELRDIKKAYEGYKGNIDKMFELIPFANSDSEARITEIVQKMVDNGEVEYYAAFFKEPKAKKLRRKKKEEKERKEVEKIDMAELEKQIHSRQEKRAQTFLDLVNTIEEKYNKKNGTDKRKSIKSKAEGETPEKRRTRSSAKK